MRSLLYRILILLAVIGLILTPPVWTGYAELHQAGSDMDGGNFARAAMHYERAVRLLPWRVNIWEQVGTAFFFSGNSQETIRFFEQARERKVLSARGYEWLGQAYWATYDLETAKEVWSTGLDAHPNYARYYYYLSSVYFHQGDMLAEQRTLERWVASGGDEVDGNSHYRLGQFLALSEPKRARQEFLLASSIDPIYDSAAQTMLATLDLASLETDEASRLVVIGRGLGLVNEWPLAAEAFRQAVAANGANAEAWAWLGEAEQQLGRDGRAELDKALSFERTNPVVRSLRGLYWMRQGRGDQALAEYLLAAEYDPENPAWQISIGDAYAQRGDLQAALRAYLRATEMDPTDATLWLLLATFSTRYNMQVEDVGLLAAEQAVELSGDDPQALDMLGWALTLLERYDEAQETLEQALSLDPELAPAHLHLAIIAMQMNDWEAALEHLRQARDLDPDGTVGEQAQLLLNQYFP